MATIVRMLAESREAIEGGGHTPEQELDIDERARMLSLTIPLPWDREAEQAVLALLIQFSRQAFELCARHELKSEDFFGAWHGSLFRRIAVAFQRKKHAHHKLLTDAIDTSHLEDRKYVEFLSKFPVSIDRGEVFIRRIKEDQRRRSILTTCAGTLQAASADDAEQSAKIFLQNLTDLLQGGGLAIRRKIDIKDDVLNAIESLEHVYQERGASFIQSGFESVDYATGIRNGELTLVLADHIHWSHRFILQIAGNTAHAKGQPTTLFYQDSKRSDVASKILALNSRIEYRMLLSGYLRERDFPALVKAASEMAESNLLICNDNLESYAQIKELIKWYHSENSTRFFLFDRIDNWRIDSSNEPISELNQRLKMLRTIAAELNVPILASAWLQRINILGSAIESKTAAFEGLADNIILFTGSSEDDLEVQLHRSHDGTRERIWLKFEENYQGFRDLMAENKPNSTDENSKSKPASDTKPIDITALSKSELLELYHILIDKKLVGSLTASEAAELTRVQERMDALDSTGVGTKVENKLLERQDEIDSLLARMQQSLEAIVQVAEKS